MPKYATEFGSDSLAVEFESNALTIQFLNTYLDYQALDALTNLINTAHSDSSVRAIAIHTASQGIDPENLGELPEHFAHRAPSGSHGIGPIVEQSLMRALHDFTKPLIAYLSDQVNAFAIDIAASCDIRVASGSMTLQDTRILQARTASSGIAYILPKLIGQSQAMRILLLGEQLDAKEASEIDFVHKVIADGEFEDFAKTFTQKIEGMATRAWQVHKLQVLGQLHLDFESAMIHSLGIRQTHVINDRKEGIQAWRERRDPNFAGT